MGCRVCVCVHAHVLHAHLARGCRPHTSSRSRDKEVVTTVAPRGGEQETGSRGRRKTGTQGTSVWLESPTVPSENEKPSFRNYRTYVEASSGSV